MNSIVDVGDSSQSPRGPRTPWSPVRVNRPHRGLSPVAPPNSDPSSFHAVLADTDSRVDVTTGAQLRGSEEQLLEPTPTGCTSGVQPHAAKSNLMDFSDDEVRVRAFIEKEMRRARVISPVDTHRRTSGYHSDRESSDDRRRTNEDRGRRTARGRSPSRCKRRTDDNVTVRRRQRQSRSHSSENCDRSRLVLRSKEKERSIRSTVRSTSPSPSRDANQVDTYQVSMRPHPSRRSSSRRSRRNYGRRLHSYSDESSSENTEVSAKLHRIKPKTFDGTGSFESFWAHFENCSEYNR